MQRTTQASASEESYQIYRGAGTNGQLIYTQPSILNSETETWKICIDKQIHTLYMTDTGDSWSSGSQLILKIDSSTLGTYRTNYSSSTIQLFASPPTNLAYSENPFVLLKNSQYSYSPTISGIAYIYTITSGSLPSGLSLNPSTGVISGTPTSTVLNRAITIKASDFVSYTTRSITLSVLDNPTSCSSGQILVSIQRVTKSNAINENFKIF